MRWRWGRRRSGEQREALEQALRYDGSNADIVIAMYRSPQADAPFRQKTLQHLQRLAQMYQTQINLAQRDLQSVAGDDGSLYLAMQLNQFAWLIANTEGDYRGALDCSLRSVELVQDAALEGGRRFWDSELTESGYRDTLARCYFAVGDLPTAVEQQRLAVELEPHSGQMRRQLDLFEAKLREAGNGRP